MAAQVREPNQFPFRPRLVTLTGTIQLDGSVGEVFEMFTPLGEKAWAEGWDPEILFPSDGSLTEGMVFRTFSSDQEHIWVVSRLEAPAYRILYHRVEPTQVVVSVEVRCRVVGPATTEASVRYRYVGLSEEGNAQIAAWTDAGYAAKMAQWEQRINDALKSARRSV